MYSMIVQHEVLEWKLESAYKAVWQLSVFLFRSEKPSSLRQAEETSRRDAGSLSNLLDAINKEFPMPGCCLIILNEFCGFCYGLCSVYRLLSLWALTFLMSVPILIARSTLDLENGTNPRIINNAWKERRADSATALRPSCRGQPDGAATGLGLLHRQAGLGG